MPLNEKLFDFREYPKDVLLRDGSVVVFRPTVGEDRKLLVEFFRSLTERDRRYFKHDVSDRKTINKWCDELDYDQVLPIIATVKNGKKIRIVANGSLHTESHGWSTHVARIRFQVRPEFRGLGLGQAIAGELCERATMRGVQKLQAHVRVDNKDVLGLLKRIGFRKEGVFKRHAIDMHGRHHDVMIFWQDLEDFWRRMEDLQVDMDNPGCFP